MPKILAIKSGKQVESALITGIGRFNSAHLNFRSVLRGESVQ